MENGLDELNNKIIVYLNNIDNSLKELNKEIGDFINLVSSRNVQFPFKNFLDFFSGRIGTKKINLTKDIYNEIKISNLLNSKIYEEKGFTHWLMSAFSHEKFIKNALEIIINTLLSKMDYILFLLIESFTEYCQDMVRTTENSFKIASINFTKEQIQLWKEASSHYKEKKEEIEKILNIITK